MISTELLYYSDELIKLAEEREALHTRLITQTASLQDFTVNLFKLCVLEFAEQVHFLVDRSELMSIVADESSCDSVYSVISNDTIIFNDYNGRPLIKIPINFYFESAEDDQL